MTFEEYAEMNERCILYKMGAIRAICGITGQGDFESAVHGQSWLNRVADDKLSYHIHFCNGYNLEGEMETRILELAMEGNMYLAKLEYAEKEGK